MNASMNPDTYLGPLRKIERLLADENIRKKLLHKY